MDDLELLLHRVILAKQLNEAVSDSGLSYEAISNRVKKRLRGVSMDSSKLSRIVNGKQDPTHLEVLAICHATNRKIEEMTPDRVSAQWLRSVVERILQK